MVKVTEREGGLLVEAATYRLHLPADRPFAVLEDAAGNRWAELFLGGSLHTREGLDETARLESPEVADGDGGVRVTVRAVSSHWARKALVLRCREESLEAHLEVAGAGRITDLHLFGGYYSGALRYGSGFFLSGAQFRSVFNPEPWGSERRAIPASEPTLIDVCGSGALPGRRHWIFTPAPFCYGFSRTPVAGAGVLRAASVAADQGGADPTTGGDGGAAAGAPDGAPGEAPNRACSGRVAGSPGDQPDLPAGPWIMAGLIVRPGEHLFTGFHYDGMEDGFSLRLAYEGQTAVDGEFVSPGVLFLFNQPDPYAGLERYVTELVSRGLVDVGQPADLPGWWREPIFCGWGAQCHLANLTGTRAPALANQANYDRFLAALESHGLRPGIVVLDDKWAAAYALGEADPAKWPDLKGWIAGRHNAGQRVLLWWKAWDPEGLPADQCVTNSAGLPVAADPSNPAYEETLRRAVRLMLSSQGYDADGFKVDFSARTPSGPGLRRHGREWGVELLYRLLWILHDEAKRVKPDALVMTHTPNPYFARVTDMIRLNDINTGSPVVAQMRHRARVARAALPHHLIDTDNWPMPSRAAWREYLQVQPELGVPSLYFATALDTMEALEEEDYAALRQLFAAAWADLR
ncbi:MAG: hypothetical protein AB2385_12955 [Symbiobacterium sp.]|uniref:hypothetical protein n=1 Tax=Symbiobacterium sp. TaxID=1971213 RepID=UPI003464648E